MNDTSFRDHAANERTMLAWIRTGIALMAFGFAISRFGLFLREVESMHAQPHGRFGSAWVGVLLVILGFSTNLAATIRYIHNRRVLLRGEKYSPHPTLVYALGIGSFLIGVAMALFLARTFD